MFKRFMDFILAKRDIDCDNCDNFADCDDEYKYMDDVVKRIMTPRQIFGTHSTVRIVSHTARVSRRSWGVHYDQPVNSNMQKRRSVNSKSKRNSAKKSKRKNRKK